MVVYDTDFNVLEDPDLEHGRVVEHVLELTLSYEVTAPAVTHVETVAEYPNGGRDVAVVVDSEERGEWKAFDDNGKQVEYHGDYPDRNVFAGDVPIVWEYGMYVPYTSEEQAEHDRQHEEMLSEKKRFEQREAFADEGPAIVDELQEGVMEVAEMSAANEVSNSEIMDAIIELGNIVAEMA